MRHSKGIQAALALLLVMSTLVFSLYLPASAQLPASSAPWPMFQQHPQRTGLTPYDTSDNPGRQKWAFTTGGNVLSSPVIGSDGTIYAGSRDNKLHAVNPDGDPKWAFTTEGWIESAPAIGSDGTVYVGSRDSRLYAVKPDGGLKWAFPTGGWIGQSSPAIGSDGTIYVGSWDNRLYAVDPDGSLKWAFPTGGWIDSSPAVGSNGTIYVGSGDNKLYAVDPDGSLKWAFPTGGSTGHSSPAVGSDGTVYVGSGDNKLYALNPDGSLKWAFPTGGWIGHSSPAIDSDGTIYVGSWDNKLYAVDPDGSLKWTFATGAYLESSPAIGSEGTIYVGSWDNKLYALKPDGSLKWAFTTGAYVESSPAIGSDGTIYVGSWDNKLYAIGKAFPVYLIYIIGAVAGGLVLIWPVRKWRARRLVKREQLEQEVEQKTQELLQVERTTAIKETELKLEQAFSGGLAHEVRNALFDGSVEIADLSGLEVPDISPLDEIIGKLGAAIFDLENQGIPRDVIYNNLLPMLQEIDGLSKRLGTALEKYSKATPTVKNSIGRGLVLAEQFLRYSEMQEIERGEEEINLYVVARKIGVKYQKAFDDSGIRYTIDSPQGEKLIAKGDYVQLEQILENPVLNARDALEGKGGEINISLSKKDDSVNIIVSDTGKGIPEENLEKVFDPFFSTKGSKGTGLGLKFVKKLVEAYGGSISIESKVAVGTHLYITLGL